VHSWGDGWPHWQTLYKAQEWIDLQMELAGYSLMHKEKWGSLRYEHIFMKDDPKPAHQREWDPIQGWKYLTLLVFSAVKEWPEIEAELMSDLAYHEELVGSEIHDKYWTK